jgi:hypothetical protein
MGLGTRCDREEVETPIPEKSAVYFCVVFHDAELEAFTQCPDGR